MKKVSNKERILRTSAVFACSLLLLNSCATLERSTFLGAGIGAAAGTGVGLGVQPNASSALIGAGVGALIGAGIGLLSYEDKQNKEAVIKALRGNRKEVIQEPPMLRPAQANCYKTNEKIVGEEYFGPQLRCRIERPAVWGLK